MRTEPTPTAAEELLSEVAADPWGTVAVSLYDTGRLIALAPWLPGHQSRIEFLHRQQRTDGGWGGPAGYALVPTLSATAGLLAELDRSPAQPDRLRRAVAGGLRALRQWLDPKSALAVPDTIGVEVVVPALLEELSPRLAGNQSPGPLLRLPDGIEAGPLAALRRSFAAGALPQKAWACLEVIGPAAAGAASVRPAGGSVGCSAAATAAWLGGPAGDQAGYEFLDQLQARTGGPVPGVTPITFFEPAWVLNSLAVGRYDVAVPPVLLDRLASGLTTDGVPAAPGLPPDSDDTAAVLAALLRHGRLRSPECLLRYRYGEYFACFIGERNPSVTANAHVLEALALYLAHRPGEQARYRGPAASTAGWLLDQQQPDGSWEDKWHASAYYATACCVLALTEYAAAGAGPAGARPGPGSPDAGGARALQQAVSWVLDSRRLDGGWGRWGSTVEETAYAVQTLSLAGDPDRPGVREAIGTGTDFLTDPPVAGHPPLWHAKDLYTPVAVVRAAQLAALRLGRRVLTPARSAR